MTWTAALVGLSLAMRTSDSRYERKLRSVIGCEHKIGRKEMKTSTLAMVCSIELLERLAYFVFLTHFVSFLSQSGQVSTTEAVQTYGSLMMAVYAGPILGGWVADRWLTVRRAARVGLFLLMSSYGLFTAMPSQILAAMCLLSAGSGLLKPSLYAVLAQGCGQSGLRRESAFIAFFVSINVGGFLGGLGGAMFGLLRPTERTFQGLFLFCALCTALAALLSLVALKPPAGQPSLLSAPSPQPGPPLQKVALWPVAVLGLTWMLGHCAVAQLNTTIMSWRNHADLTLGGLVPLGLGAALLTGGEPLFQLVLVPLVVLGFLALRKRGIEPSATAKIGIGLVLQLLPCALLLRGVVNMPDGLPLGGWLLGARLAGALPSLLLLPLMLSVLAQLVPARRHGALFGLWSLLTAVMSWLGGHLAAWTRELSPSASFVTPAVFALLAAGLWIAQSKRIERALLQDTGAAPGYL